LLKYKDGDPLFEAAPNLSSTVTRLQNFFGREYPEILPLLDDFVLNIEKSAGGGNRQWFPATAELIDLKDEVIINQIPANCLRQSADGSWVPDIHQTVIRRPSEDPFNYLYDPQILNLQKVQNPLQYSFFMIHEWLWDLSQDVEVVRKLNWLIHSRDLERYDRDGLISLFDNLGIFQIKLPPCSRTRVIKSQFAGECEEVSLKELGRYDELKLVDLPEGFLFRVGDFYGFSAVTSLKLQGQSLERSLHPRIFQPLYSLKNLDLSSSHLTSLSREVTKDLRHLENLKFENNSLSEIPESWQELVGLSTLSFTVTPELLVSLKTLENLPPHLKNLILFGDRSMSERLAKMVGELRPEVIVRYGTETIVRTVDESDLSPVDRVKEGLDFSGLGFLSKLGNQMTAK
jgi:Leucine-rich repeat (LRR) protein